MMLQKGMDIATVSRYLGHSDIKTTQNYVNPTQEDLQIAGEMLGSMYDVDLDPSTTKNTTIEVKIKERKLAQSVL